MRTEQSMAVHEAAVGDANHKLKRSNVTEGRGIGRATEYGYGFLSSWVVSMLFSAAARLLHPAVQGLPRGGVLQLDEGQPLAR